ncbi:hypothetical protein [Bdellovibrio sp. HCB2-146]|uniref:hypothetical protein n=1 Tax=Bdellovibrio sp. HCB2-146 TaxID=3394362 RepID=UPI0039BCF194
MKNSVVIAFAILALPLSAVANKIVTVKGQGTTSGYFEINDEWSLTPLKNRAKKDADKEAQGKCAKLRGKPLLNLASYTSTCKPQPRFWTAAGYWHDCKVTVLLDCEIKKADFFWKPAF